MTVTLTRSIAADHPSLPGHFPGKPIVPGVVILDEVFSAWAELHPGSGLTGVAVVKFLRPLEPEQAFTISLTSNDDMTLDFSCSADEQPIAQGRFLLGSYDRERTGS